VHGPPVVVFLLSSLSCSKDVYIYIYACFCVNLDFNTPLWEIPIVKVTTTLLKWWVSLVEQELLTLTVDWFCLFIDLWVLTFPLEDCSVFGNFVITLIYRAHEFTSVFSGVRVSWFLILYVCFVDSFFVLLYVFFWPLCCLFFFIYGFRLPLWYPQTLLTCELFSIAQCT